MTFVSFRYGEFCPKLELVENSEYNENKSSSRKAVIPVLLFLILLGLYYYKDSLLGFFTEKKSAALAEVSSFRNDVRVKDSKSIDFKSTKENEQIHHGDSLSTGSGSSALVTFKNGQLLNIDQNSLIIFDELTDTPEFVKGNIKLSVKGKMKLKIENEIVEIDGNQSDIQFYRDDKTKVQKIVLLKGTAVIKAPKAEAVSLQKNIAVEAKKVSFSADSVKNQRDPSNSAPTLSIVVPKAPVAVRGHYKLYDYYSRMLSSSTDLGRNKNFVLRPNYDFEPFTTSSVSASPQVNEDEDPTKNPFAFNITDPSGAAGYVVEVSAKESFPDSETVYGWKSSYFSQNFTVPGTYYVRFRKVLSGQVLTEYSSTEKIEVAPKIPKPVIAVEKIKPPPVEVIKRPVPVVFKAAPVETKPVVVQRKLAAVEPQPAIQPQAMQSTVKTAPADLIRNQNYHLSNVALSASQSYLVSGKQLANSGQLDAGYNLEVNATHWINQQGFRASYNKAMTTQSSTNLVTTAELSYLYRFSQPWSWTTGGKFQYYLSAGFENYQNSKSTSDFVDSYNLFKMGIGASMPVFSFWSIDGHLSYGFGSSKKSSFSIMARANYFFTKTVSLGLGFRARKFDYYLLDEQNYESLSETFTTLNMYY